MDLEQFVTETLTQIAKGVKESCKNVADSGGLVNPRGVRVATERGHPVYGYIEEINPQACDRVVELVEFDVAVLASEGTQTKGGIGIIVGPVVLGTRGKSETASGSESRLKFRVPMVLPNPE